MWWPRRALVVLVAVAFLAGCGSSEQTPLPPGPAPPQAASLDWVERYPGKGPAVVFRAEHFEVTTSGWRAEIGLENQTSTTIASTDPTLARRRSRAAG